MMSDATCMKHYELKEMKTKRSNIQPLPLPQPLHQSLQQLLPQPLSQPLHQSLHQLLSQPLHRICNPMPSGKGFAIPITPTTLTRRAFFLLCVFLMSISSAWGQTFNGTLISGAKTYTKYIKNNVSTTTVDMTGDLSQIVSDLNELKGSSAYTVDNIYQHIYIRWCIKDASDNIVTSIVVNGYSIGTNDWHITSEYLYNNAPWTPTNGNMFWFYTYNYLYQDADFKAKILKPQFTINSSKTFADYDGYTLECYITDDNDGLTYAEHP